MFFFSFYMPSLLDLAVVFLLNWLVYDKFVCYWAHSHTVWCRFVAFLSMFVVFAACYLVFGTLLLCAYFNVFGCPLILLVVLTLHSLFGSLVTFRCYWRVLYCLRVVKEPALGLQFAVLLIMFSTLGFYWYFVFQYSFSCEGCTVVYISASMPPTGLMISHVS
jgi:hypothetical protein